MPNCLHCRQTRYIRARGLCELCWKDRTIRVRYPARPSGVPAGTARSPYRDPTAAELDALVAQQSAILPPWWHHAEECQR